MHLAENLRIIKGRVFEAMTAEEFFYFCQENENLNFERDEKGNILVMAPTGSSSGSLNNSISGELYLWNRKHKLGLTFDSSTGFTLPDGSQRSPDAAWMSNKKWNSLSPEQKKVFAPACPEFIIELRSSSDGLAFLQNKMQMWIRNGAHLAWLIDPIDQKAYIYRKDTSVDVIKNFNTNLSGEDVLPEFSLALNLLKIADL